MDPGISGGTDRGHRLALGEDLGIRTDPDFQVLAPGALRDQHLLQLRRLRGPGPQFRQVVADQPLHLRADRRGSVQVAAGTLLDHAFQHRNGEGDAGRLDGLQVDRCQQHGFRRITGFGRRVGKDVADVAEALAVGRTEGRGRVGALAQVTHGGECAGDVPCGVVPDCHHRRTVHIRPPDPPGQRGIRGILGQRRTRRYAELGHAVSCCCRAAKLARGAMAAKAARLRTLHVPEHWRVASGETAPMAYLWPIIPQPTISFWSDLLIAENRTPFCHTDTPSEASRRDAGNAGGSRLGVRCVVRRSST